MKPGSFLSAVIGLFSKHLRRAAPLAAAACIAFVAGTCAVVPGQSAALGESPAPAPGNDPSPGDRGQEPNAALNELKLAEADKSLLSVQVTSVPGYSVFAGMATDAKPLSIPLQARRQVLIQLRPNLALGEIQSLLDEHGVEPVKVIPEIGLVVAQLRGPQGLKAAATVRKVDDIDELEVFATIDRLSQDSRVEAAAPNSVLSTLQLRSAVQGKNIPGAGAGAATPGESQDWGMTDAHIAEIWPRLPATSTVGVIDVGFAAHNDLELRKGLQIEMPVDNHGNHVAGILCAKHNNIGVRGVLPNCTVVYATAEALLLDSGQIAGNDDSSWFAFFADYIASVLTFMRLNPEVKVINLSLGYNWLPNFNRDPRLEARVKNLIMSQGRIFMSMLETAAASDVAIVSAAGNDSDGLENPLEAKWASPFNYGTNLMLGTRGWTNGLVVAAHDRNGARAPFSNVGGDITCPGVDILSTTAASASSTALMSGTSMASPYCAGALAALRAVMPGITLRNAMRCLRRSPRSIAGVPAMDLKYAIEHCTNNEQTIAREEREEAIRRWSAVLSDGQPAAALATTDSCSYQMRKEFAVSAVVDLGDGQGPAFTNADSRTEVGNYVRQVMASGCRQPALITLRFGFDAAYQQRLDFALATLNAFNQAQYPGGAMLVEVPQFGQSAVLRQFPDRVVVIVGDARLAANLSGQR